MSKKRVAQIVVETLEQAGVRRCYGIVGDTLNYVTDAMTRSKIQWVHTRHEEAAAFAAGADSFMTGVLTTCAGSCGPGGLHFINGLFEAQRNNAPVVLIASQLATSSLGTDFPQEVDFKAIYGSWTVFCEQIQHPSQAKLITKMAAQTALNKMGVAVIILPVDISVAEVMDEMPYSVFHPKPVIRPSNESLKIIADHLNNGKKVGIYAGIGTKDAHDELIALAKKLNAPIAHTTRAKDFVEYDNPFNVGMTGILGGDAGYEMLLDCDTLLLLGADFAWAQFYPKHATIIQIDQDATHLGRRHPISVGVAGDCKASLEALMPLLHQKTDRTFLDHSLKAHAKMLEKEAHQERATKDELIHPQYLVKLLNQYADDDAIFTADGGSAMVWVSRHIKVNGKRRTLSSFRHGTMANAMPQALGLQKAFPKRQVITLSGDGGLAMLLGDLLTMVQENLPIKIVVLNNASLDFVELEQKVEGLLDHYTDLKNPNFAKLGESIGFLGIRVERGDHLEASVKQFLAHDGPAILDVLTNPKELVMPPNITLAEISGMVLYASKAVLDGRISDVKNLLVNNFIK